MIYLTLNNVEQSIDRVKQRVNTGGHFVDDSSIRYNFDEGLKNLDFFSDRFDNLEIFDASGNYGELNPLLSINQQRLFTYASVCLMLLKRRLTTLPIVIGITLELKVTMKTKAMIIV